MFKYKICKHTEFTIFQVVFLQEGFSYLLQTREEKLFVNMQYRLQQASINDRERRILLSQLESRTEAQENLVILQCGSQGAFHIIAM